MTDEKSKEIFERLTKLMQNPPKKDKIIEEKPEIDTKNLTVEERLDLLEKRVSELEKRDIIGTIKNAPPGTFDRQTVWY